MADSIRQHGVLQPILVRQVEDFCNYCRRGRYRAAKEAGLEEIPSIILDVDEQTAAQLSIIENVQRGSEPGRGSFCLRKILQDFGWTQEELGKSLGKSRSYISNMLRLLRMEEPYRQALRGNHHLQSGKNPAFHEQLRKGKIFSKAFKQTNKCS